MEMEIEIQRGSKPLHECHGAALRLIDAVVGGAALEMTEYRLDEDVENGCHHVGVIRQPIAPRAIFPAIFRAGSPRSSGDIF
jgi:hypothetical protein